MNEEIPNPTRVGQGMDYGEQADVHQVHAAVQREKREPGVGREPLAINQIESGLWAGGVFRRRLPRSLLGKF